MCGLTYLALAVLTLSTTACSSLPSREPTQSVPSHMSISLLTLRQSPDRFCGGVALGTFKLHFDPDADPSRQVWVLSASGERLWPVWPRGWTAELNAELAIQDENGRVVLTSDSSFEAGGSRGRDSVVICSINGTHVM
jgi:hypothetical protein